MKLLSLVACCFLAALSTQPLRAASSRPLTLVENGKSSYVITLPGHATPAEKTAAQELQHYLAQISGAKLPIRSETQIKTGTPQILVGLSTQAKKLAAAEMKKIGRDGIIVKRAGKNLVVAGDRPRGALYAVQELLESFGVRWWTKTESFVPKKPTLRVLSNTVYTPPFFYREHYTREVQDDALFATRARENGHHQTQDAKLGSHYTIIGFVHTFDQMLPPEKYFAEHPEWYSDVNNGNKPCTAASKMPAPQQSQLNLTNTEMRAELLKKVMERIRENPSAGVISVSQNDNANYCRSEGDMALIEREGTPAAPIIDLVNFVADEVKKEYPGFLVETLAYWYSRKPTKTLRPRDNVLIRLCSIEADFSRPLTASTNADFRADMEGWKKLTKSLYVWDYITNFGNVIWPHPNFRVLGPNLRFFAANNVVGMFEQGDAYSNGVGDFVHLRTWLISKLMWNPQRDENALIDEYLRGYYGAAAPHLRAYIEGMQDAFLKSGGKLSTFQSDHSYLNLDVVESSWKHFQAAQNAVKNNPVLAARVRRERLALDHVILARYTNLRREVKARQQKNPEYSAASLPADMTASAEEFVRTARANHVGGGREGGTFDEIESSLRTRFAKPIPLPADLKTRLGDPDEERLINVTPNMLRLYMKGSISDVVDNAAASTGKAARLLGSSNEWALQYDVTDASEVLKDKPWTLYALARVEPKPNAKWEGAAFSAGVYDTVGKKSRLDKTVPIDATLADGKYHLIEIGRTDLDEGSYVYIAPPQRDDIAFVFIDRLILVRDP